MKSFIFFIVVAALCDVSFGSKVYETLSEEQEFQELTNTQEEVKCHFYRTREKCILNACYWCKSAAVPSSCYTKDEASQLPPAVFQCDKEQSSSLLLRTEPEEKTKEKITEVVEEKVTDSETKCHFYRTKEKCILNACYWCKSAAVPSSCYTKDEASQLPPAVFQCDKEEDKWELTKIPTDPVEIQRLFQKWKITHQKHYTSAFEEQIRLKIFLENAQLIVRHNSNPSRASYTIELNEFADITWKEFQQWYLATPQKCSATHTADSSSYLASITEKKKPGEKDWRQEGMVSPVKSQGKCGSCWTFSTTGCLESHHKIKHGGAFVFLSEQNLLDCAQAFDNHGCRGGLPSHAFEYIKYNGGIDTEKSYPYLAKKDSTCHFDSQTIGARVHQVVNITSRDEDQLMGTVGIVGPVSIAFQVVSDFRFYKEGVYSSKNCHQGEKDVNHAVLAVGYGIEKDTNKKYWIVKNSWGPKWGMKGFFEIEKDVNMCGLADCASYPIVR